ncbi:MAG: DUF126 domain-containing protein [Crenarchaeota archaeon]|nr:DUF126 domain-containing protein [Thermoproteota archaeon]
MCKLIYRTEGNKICGRVIKLDYVTLLGDIDPDKGALRDGRELKNKILMYIEATGSTVGSYILYALSKRDKSPRAILCVEIDNLTLVGCVLGGIPLIKISREEYDSIRDGANICIEFDNTDIDECHIDLVDLDERELHT